MVGGGEAPQPSFALQLVQFWQLVRDCRLTGKQLPLASVDLCVAKSIEDPPQLLELRAELESQGVPVTAAPVIDPHNPSNELQYRDFCEALVRIAHGKFYSFPQLERRVNTLVTTLLLPLAGNAEKDEFQLRYEELETQDTLAEFDEDLFRAFLVLVDVYRARAGALAGSAFPLAASGRGRAHRSPCRPPWSGLTPAGPTACPGDVTSVRECLCLLEECGLVSHPKPVPPPPASDDPSQPPAAPPPPPAPKKGTLFWDQARRCFFTVLFPEEAVQVERMSQGSDDGELVEDEGLPGDTEPWSLDIEILFTEFIEALLRCAEAALPNPEETLSDKIWAFIGEGLLRRERPPPPAEEPPAGAMDGGGAGSA